MRSPGSEPVLAADSVVKRFGGVTAVAGASMQVHPGEIVALIGPNGAGKSTFARIVTGEERPDEGRVTVKGVDVTQWPTYKISRMGVGRTYQTGRLFWSMSVIENLLASYHPQIGDTAFGSLFRRRASRQQEAELTARAFDLLDVVGLRSKATEMAGSLSGGQRRLVEVARLLMTNADVAVLDEPTAGLAPSMVSLLEDSLRMLADRGIGLLVVEHHMGLVGRVSHRVRVMVLGKILAEGTYEEIRENAAVREAYLGA